MKIIVDLHIICDLPGNKHVHSIVGKEFESNLVPVKGMQFEDSAWKDPREIKEVTLNPTENYYYLYVGEDCADNIERCEMLKQMYISHDWTRLERK